MGYYTDPYHYEENRLVQCESCGCELEYFKSQLFNYRFYCNSCYIDKYKEERGVLNGEERSIHNT